MYLYFNKLTKDLTTVIPHGEKVRQGGYLNITVCLDEDSFGITEDYSDWTCNIELSFPNGKLGTTMLTSLPVRRDIFEKVSDSEVTYDLVDGRSYLMYDFKFAPEQATTEAGKIEASVSIVKTQADLTKQGTAKTVRETDLIYFGTAEIYVEKTFGYNKRVIDESSLHYKNLMNNINNLDARKMNKDQVIKEIENRSTDEAEVAEIIESYMTEAELLDIGTNQNLDITSDNQIPTSKTVDTMIKNDRLSAGQSVKIDYENKKIDILVDETLKNDSKNPVQNKVVKTELDKKQNVINEENKLDYSLVKNTPYIPKRLSDLENDKNFIDNTVSNLKNYYLKTESYNKEEIQKLLSAISSLKMEIVEELPITNISTTTIYLKLRQDGEENNIYEEYVYINEKWEMIGTTAMKIDGLATEEYVDKRIEDFHPIYEYEIPELEGATWFRFAEVVDETQNSSGIFTIDLYGTKIVKEEVRLSIYNYRNLYKNTEYNFKLVGNLQKYIDCINRKNNLKLLNRDDVLIDFSYVGTTYNDRYSLTINNVPKISESDDGYFSRNELIQIDGLEEEFIVVESETAYFETVNFTDFIKSKLSSKYCNFKKIKGYLELSCENINGGTWYLKLDDKTVISIENEFAGTLTKTGYIEFDLDKNSTLYMDSGGPEFFNLVIKFRFDLENTEFEMAVPYTPQQDTYFDLSKSNISQYGLIISLFEKREILKDQILTTSVFAVSCNELNGKIISDVLPISQSYDLSGTDASGGTTGSGDPIGGGSGGGEVGSGGGGSGGSLYYGLGAITLEQFEKERYVCGLVNFPATTQFKDLRVKLKIENNLNFKALPELEKVDLKEENQNDLQLLEGTELEDGVPYNFTLKGNLKKYFDNKENYETGVDIYFAAEEGVMPEKIELFKDWSRPAVGVESTNLGSSGGGASPGTENEIINIPNLRIQISKNIGCGNDILSKVSGTLVVSGDGFTNPKFNGEILEYNGETERYEKYFENVEDSEAKITVEVTDEMGGSYYHDVQFNLDTSNCEFTKIESFTPTKTIKINFYEIKNNDVFDFNLKLQEQILHTVSKSYELFSVFDKLSEVDKNASAAKYVADSAYSYSSMLNTRLQNLEGKISLEIIRSWMYEPVLENSQNVIDLLNDVMRKREGQWANNVGDWSDAFLINSTSNNLYSYLVQSRTENKWNDEIGDYQKILHISISPLILPTDKYPDQPLIGKIFAEVPYTEHYHEDETPDRWEYNITEDMYTAEEYGVDEEEVVEILNNNAELVEELDIGTSETIDVTSDNQVPTSKAVNNLIPTNLSDLNIDVELGVNEDDVLEILDNHSQEVESIETEEIQTIAIGTSSTFDATSDEQIPTSKAVADNYQEKLIPGSNVTIENGVISTTSDVKTEDVVEIIKENSELVETFDIGTSENYDLNKDDQVPTTKAINSILNKKIKTINGESLIGSGNITISGGSGGGGSLLVKKNTLEAFEAVGGMEYLASNYSMAMVYATVCGNHLVIPCIADGFGEAFNGYINNVFTWVGGVIQVKGNVYADIYDGLFYIEIDLIMDLHEKDEAVESVLEDFGYSEENFINRIVFI